MPLDKQKSGTPAKPFTPTLSTAFRNSKSPLTPKLAGPKISSPVSPPRRALRPEPSAASISRREDFRSPATSKLSGNITPRSGARVSRIGGDSPSTPGSSHTGTPSKIRPLSAIERPKPRRYNGTVAGLGIENPENNQATPPFTPNEVQSRIVSGELGRRVSTGSPRNRSAKPTSPRLLNANDIHSSSRSELGTPKVRKPITFLYASDVGRRTHSPEPLQAIDQLSFDPEEQGKFCYANGRPTDQPSTPQNMTMDLTTCPAAIPSPESHPPTICEAPQVAQKPSSPMKAASLQSAPTIFSSASDNSIKAKTTDVSAKPRSLVTPSHTPRRASTSSKTSTVRQTAQRKLSISSSAPSTPPQNSEFRVSPRAYISQGLPRQPAVPLSPTRRFSPRSASLSSSNTGVSTQTLDSTPSTSLHPHSPIKSEAAKSTQPQRTNELASNARRERKVLDLEISNSSLLAINRTLEREMRKQSLELRRFRRLSRRSSRRSLASTSIRSVSGQSGPSTLPASEAGSGVYNNLYDLEEMDISDPDLDSDGDVDSSVDDDDDDGNEYSFSYLPSQTSHTDLNSKTHRRRARDEKRLLLDLDKHQQLLIDSQKMNQSIKRCLNWTDELIAEGKKALDYHVKVSDVKIGGKVLVANEDEDGDGGGSVGGTPRKGLLSPSLPPSSPPLPSEVEQGRRLWRLGLEEMEVEVDRMLDASSTLKDVVVPDQGVYHA